MSLIRNQVFEQIRSDIVTCRLKPGEELREADLADRYNVSKSPVREALRQLQFETLIETSPRRGHRVTPISLSDALDILEMREVLETAAVRKIAKVATDAQLERLDVYREAESGDTDAFNRYNRRFHSELVALAGNKRLEAEMVRLMEAYKRMFLVSVDRLKDATGGTAKALADHGRIIDALQARDVRGAVAASRQHLRQSRGLVVKGLSNPPIVD